MKYSRKSTAKWKSTTKRKTHKKSINLNKPKLVNSLLGHPVAQLKCPGTASQKAKSQQYNHQYKCAGNY